MKNLIIKLILFLLPIIIIVGLINFIIDPAHIFDNKYEKGMVDIINSGNNVANIGNYDERLFQKIFIKELSNPKNIISIGSSRSMQIRENLFNNEFFNNSVSGASLEDYIAITQLYNSNNKLPENIILGVDPWIFNKNNNQDRWQVLEEYYYSFINNKDIKINKSSFYDNLTNLLSIKYFQESIRYILNGNFNEKYFPTKDTSLSSKIKLNDGSLVYGINYRDVSISEIEDKAKNYINGDIYSIEKFNQIDDKYLNQFKMLINFYKSKNINITIFLPPYHPIVYKYIVNNDKYRMVNEVELYLNRFAQNNNIKLVGSYNPEKFNLNYDGFYDGMHPKEKSINKIFEK